MAEKRGETEKLKYDFNTAGCLEVQMKSGNWFRVTSREFRSFDGPRRITEQSYVVHGRVTDIPLVQYEYKGPVYAYATNKRVRKENTQEIVRSIHYDKMREDSKKWRS